MTLHVKLKEATNIHPLIFSHINKKEDKRDKNKQNNDELQTEKQKSVWENPYRWLNINIIISELLYIQ